MSGRSSPKRPRVSASKTAVEIQRSRPRRSVHLSAAVTTWPRRGRRGWPPRASPRRSLRDPRAQRRALVRGVSRHPEARRRRRAARYQLLGRRRSRPSSATPARSCCSSASKLRSERGRQPAFHWRTCTRNPTDTKPLEPLEPLEPMEPDPVQCRGHPLHDRHDLGSEGRRPDARQPAGRARRRLRRRRRSPSRTRARRAAVVPLARAARQPAAAVRGRRARGVSRDAELDRSGEGAVRAPASRSSRACRSSST